MFALRCNLGHEIIIILQKANWNKLIIQKQTWNMSQRWFQRRPWSRCLVAGWLHTCCPKSVTTTHSLTCATRISSTFLIIFIFIQLLNCLSINYIIKKNIMKKKTSKLKKNLLLKDLSHFNVFKKLKM